MSKSRRGYFPARQGAVPVRLQRPRVEIDAGLGWYVVWCRSRAERKAKLDLERAGFSTYLPAVGLRIIRRGRTIEIEKQPVSRYLFVGLCASQPDFDRVEDALWDFIPFDVRGSLIRNNRDPVRVPAGALQAFADECARGWAPGLAGAHLGLRPGDKARIISGAFSGLAMDVDQIACDGRLRGLVDMFGGRVSVEATADQLQAA